MHPRNHQTADNHCPARPFQTRSRVCLASFESRALSKILTVTRQDMDTGQATTSYRMKHPRLARIVYPMGHYCQRARLDRNALLDRRIPSRTIAPRIRTRLFCRLSRGTYQICPNIHRLCHQILLRRLRPKSRLVILIRMLHYPALQPREMSDQERKVQSISCRIRGQLR